LFRSLNNLSSGFRSCHFHGAKSGKTEAPKVVRHTQNHSRCHECCE
jgi:hypothetical protein